MQIATDHRGSSAICIILEILKHLKNGNHLPDVFSTRKELKRHFFIEPLNRGKMEKLNGP